LAWQSGERARAPDRARSRARFCAVGWNDVVGGRGGDDPRQPEFTLLAGGGGVSDGVPATQANLIGLGDLVSDAAGNLYVSDAWSNRIRMVAPDGTISTIVGNAGVGFSGDGGSAASAKISGPTGLVRDAAGNLYFADAHNHRVRRIGVDGVITTIAGNGADADAGDGGQALAASLMSPSGLGIDAAGNLYVADALANRVRKIATDGTITTVAGNGTVGYSGDYGPATSAQLSRPSGIDVDADGKLYIADLNNGAVRVVGRTGRSPR
jgi:sugar lactone lactonase YvrE